MRGKEGKKKRCGEKLKKLWCFRESENDWYWLKMTDKNDNEDDNKVRLLK